MSLRIIMFSVPVFAKSIKFFFAYIVVYRIVNNL